MGDVFKEQLVKRLPSRKDALIKAALIGAGFFITVAVYIFIFEFLPIVIAVLGFGIYYAFSMMNREFEYIFTNGDLDIDCIYGKSRRKRKFSGDIKEIIVMAHSSDTSHNQEFETAKETLACGRGPVSDETWYILTLYQSKRVKLIFDPNEMMLDAMRPYLGRKFVKRW